MSINNKEFCQFFLNDLFTVTKIINVSFSAPSLLHLIDLIRSEERQKKKNLKCYGTIEITGFGF